MAATAAEIGPKARPDVVLRRVGNEWVLFDAKRDRAHVLNLAAAIVWTYCDGGHSASAIADAISREISAEAGARITDDVEDVIRRFASQGLLQ